MAEINPEYYGTKDQWLPAPGTSDNKLKIGINGSLRGYNKAGKLAVNEKLDQSIKMFGYTNPVADKLHRHSIYRDIENKQVIHVQDYDKSGDVGYFATKDIAYLDSMVKYDKSTITQSNQAIVNGLGLTQFTGDIHMDRAYPVVDFDYLHHVNLIQVCYMQDFHLDEATGHYVFSGTAKADLDTFYKSLNTGTNVICAYSLHTYSGTTTSSRYYESNRGIYCISDYEYPVGNHDEWGYRTFTYFPRQYNVQGAGFRGIDFDTPDFNNKLTVCFNGGEKWELITAYKGTAKYTITKFNGTKEDILQQACFSGLYFTGTEQKAKTGVVGAEMTDEGIYAPVIEDGIITGEYKAGKAAAKLPQSGWTEDIKHTSGYDPAKPPGPAPIVTPLKKPALTGTNAFTSTYLMQAADLKKFVDICCNSDDTIMTQIVNDLKMFGEKPLEAVTSLMLFPFNTQHYTSSTATDTIKLGKYDTNIRCFICNDSSVIFDMGSITVPTADNFLSYEPYSTALLYVPYCGMTPLSMQYISGKTLSVSITVDIMTGGCEGVVFCNGGAIAYLTGVMGCQIPLTSSDNYSIVNSLLDNLKVGTSTFISGGITTAGVNLKKGASGKIGSAIAGIAGQAGLGLAATAISTAKDVAFDYFTEPTHFSSSGTSGSTLSYFNPQYPYLIIEKTTSNETADFGHYIGYRVDDYKTLSTLEPDDFIQCADVILENIPKASAEELDIIENALKTGVYI